jgi:hypothetical protein
LKNKVSIKKKFKTIRTKIDIKIKWNKMLRDETKKQVQLWKWLKTKQIAIKKIKIKFDRWKIWGWNWKNVSLL